MPEISTGYWKAMKRPSHAASSGFMASKSLPLNSTSPWVTWKVSRRASACASVLLPEPFGPMMECTSPAFTFRSMPLRISWLSTLTCRFLISSKLIPVPLTSCVVATFLQGGDSALPDAAFQTDAQELLRLDCKLHGQLAEHTLAEAVHDHGNGIFRLQPPLPQVEELILADLRGGSLMLHAGAGVPHLDVREGVGTALVANQKRVALRVVARASGPLQDLHLTSIGVLAVASRDALCDDGAARVLADVDHFGPCIGLLVVVGEGNRVELTHRVLTLQDAARILPGNGGTGLHLCPGDLRVRTQALAPFGHEVVDPAFAFFVARVPVLHRRVLDLRVVERDQLDHGSVQLVFVADGCSAAFEVTDVGALVGDDQRAFELAGVRRVNAEVGGKFHRAANPLWHIGERPVREYGRVQRCEEVVGIRHH